MDYNLTFYRIDGIKHEPQRSSLEQELLKELESNKKKQIPEELKIVGPIPIASYLVMIMEMCERFAYYGISILIMPYMVHSLNMSDQQSVATNRVFQFCSYLATPIAAILADACLGKFYTILLFSFIYLAGLLVLAIFNIVSYTNNYSSGLLPSFFISLFLFIPWGIGGVKTNLSSFVADQINFDFEESEKHPGMYYDDDLTIERTFRLFYWFINVGSLLGQIICASLNTDNMKTTIAFSIPCIIFMIGMVIFAAGKRKYIKLKINNLNPLGIINECVRDAKINSRLYSKTYYKVDHWLDFSKLNLINKKYDEQFVDSLKKSLYYSRVYLFYIVYWALYFNMSDSFLTQGMNMKKPSWLKPQFLWFANGIFDIITIPLLEFAIIPILRRRFKIKLGMLTRINIGFGLCTIAFIYVTILQSVVYHTGPYYNFKDVKGPRDDPNIYNNVSIIWQLGPYILIAASEVFASSTGLEYAYKVCHPKLRSMFMALYMLTNCGGSLIGIIFTVWSKDPNYTVLFAVLTCLMGCLTIVFYFCFKNEKI